MGGGAESGSPLARGDTQSQLEKKKRKATAEAFDRIPKRTSKQSRKPRFLQNLRLSQQKACMDVRFRIVQNRCDLRWPLEKVVLVFTCLLRTITFHIKMWHP